MTSVSVIIPTWNREATIEKAVLSALRQTHYIKEVLVCDDGSTDNSEKIVSAIKDERVKWIKGIHYGIPSIPRNRGIQLSTGEWIAFLDSDDEWLPDKVLQQIELAEKLATSAVCSNVFRIKAHVSPSLYLQYANEKISFNDLLRTNFVICSTAMIKRSLLNITSGFPESPELKALEDYALWLRVATQTDFAYVNAPLVNYTDEPLQSVRANDVNVWAQRKKVFHDFQCWIKNTGSPAHIAAAQKEYRKAERLSHKGLFSFILKHL